MSIHPTAIVHPSAKIHESATIGPFCIVEADVVVGEGTILDSSVVLHSGTILGKNNRIFHGASMGGLPQDLSFKSETKTQLIIGDNNLIREGAIIHRGTKPETPTTIGNNNYLMGNMHLAHDGKIGNHVIVVQNTILAGVVDIGNYVFISGLVAVHQFGRIGDYSMLAGCSKIVKDVPPYVTIDGNPATVIGLNAVGMKRAGIAPEVRNAIKATYKVIYHSGLNTKQALAKLKSENSPIPEVQNIIRFFETSKRGVTDHRQIGSGKDSSDE
ncbi:acyl-ACP--UDP-N-acetylglucosamine O-acyltransferase [Leptospira sp. GIMC2001]|uniref:acyl-ACP--UDP-N-acetylglucosamine O-acyltransferase n=1 Tax=Leptospira sp. GIMC2001 TaxID=1513297 RepID=UPI00234BCD35|nr:acyl-ACP--UDP-N-acetylglucosamine O-acyltransferase [Leptospira sp. GIMC2001]WCL51396.1 acyl-ACP--UDP-N-acetylglucosamine O-acyltransferase [Leptospira sp. GIMC2001]